MRQLNYVLVDVFTDRMFGGNQLAVFPDASEVPPELMQPIAKEFNLSETTFVLPPTDPANDYRVRIFTPATELPIAGHPTIGTAFVLARQRAEATGEMALCFEEGVGPVPVTVHFADGQPDLIWMEQPVPTFDPRPEEPAVFAELLSLPPEAVVDTGLPVEVGSCGAPFLFIPVRDLAAMREARYRMDVADRLPAEACGGSVFFFTQDVEDPSVTVHSRMFAPQFNIPEDPATGGASGPLGAYLVRHGVVTEAPTAHIIGEQGIEMGRPSRIAIEVDHANGAISAVRVGGRCVAVGEGTLTVR